MNTKQPKTVQTPVAGETPSGVGDINMSIGNHRLKPYPEVKTSGIKVRGGKAQTKGMMARGPMA